MSERTSAVFAEQAEEAEPAEGGRMVPYASLPPMKQDAVKEATAAAIFSMGADVEAFFDASEDPADEASRAWVWALASGAVVAALTARVQPFAQLVELTALAAFPPRRGYGDALLRAWVDQGHVVRLEIPGVKGK